MRTYCLITIACLIAFAGCTREKSETSTRGHLHILIPESAVPPAIDEVRAFLNMYSSDGANIDYQIVSSDQAIRRIGRDSIRFIFSTRPLSVSERLQLPRTEGSDLGEVLIAYDAIAVVVQEKNLVGEMTTDELAKVLSGEIGRWEQLSKSKGMKGKIELVFEDSSDVASYVDARILQGKSVRTDFKRANSSLGTLQLVAAQPLAIGLTGVTWIDSAHAATKTLDIAEDRHTSDTTFRVPNNAFGKFYSPHPANIYRTYYPLKRAIYAYWYAPLGSLAIGFGSYVSHADGQRLFLKRNIVPATQVIKLKGVE